MGVRMEWFFLAECDLDIWPAGECVDQHGTTNLRPAIVGPGFCIEGSITELLTTLDHLRSQLVALITEKD
jgi:hypothetical protein